MSDVGELRAALKRCHALLQDAEAWIDPDLHPAWSVAVTEELKPCDEAMECPTVLPQPGEVVLLAKYHLWATQAALEDPEPSNPAEMDAIARRIINSALAPKEGKR